MRNGQLEKLEPRSKARHGGQTASATMVKGREKLVNGKQATRTPVAPQVQTAAREEDFSAGLYGLFLG